MTVVARAFADFYAENTTYVTSGPFAGLVAMAVGAQVLGVPADGRTTRPVARRAR